MGETILPIFNIDEIVHEINSSKALRIEFVGKKGRGKSTHLNHLHNMLPAFPLFELDSKSVASEIINHPAPTVFIDSIHHLNVLSRIKLFKTKKTIVYTTHKTRKLECLMARKELNSIRFHGINKESLNQVLNKRLVLASVNDTEEIEKITEFETDKLIEKFGDNYRKIINHLYEIYQ